MIDNLRGELESKQEFRYIKNCLYPQSTRHYERYFALQDTNYKFDQNNITNSDIPINSHKEVTVIDKETINDNHEKSTTQKSNQKSMKNEITTDVINKISFRNQNSSSTKEHNKTELGHNESKARKNVTKDKEIVDKTDSNNNTN